jgi:hypothetical protein
MFLYLHIHFTSDLTLSITVWKMPDAVDTVVRALDDEYHLKHVSSFQK